MPPDCKHTGSARSAAEASTPLIVTAANGVKVAQLAYSLRVQRELGARRTCRGWPT